MTNSEFKEIESQLARVTPAAVPERLFDRIEAGLRAPETEVESADKVVPFPGRPRVREARRSGAWNAWWAAAAVAMLGALFAWFVPQQSDEGPIVVSSQRWNRPIFASVPATPATSSTAAARGVVPAAFGSHVGDVRDEGVVWPAPGRAMRKIRVTYLDVVKVKDAHGRTVEATIPRVQYVLVPEQVD